MNYIGNLFCPHTNARIKPVFERNARVLEGLCDDHTQLIYTRQLKIEVDLLLCYPQIKLRRELRTPFQTREHSKQSISRALSAIKFSYLVSIV